MKVSDVLNYIAKEELERLSLEYKVNYQVKKLDGQTNVSVVILNVKRSRKQPSDNGRILSFISI